MSKLIAFGTWIWKALDGWKTWIWAVTIALEHAFPGLGCWQWVDGAAKFVHLDTVVPAVDPDQLVKWGTFAIAIGHRLVKAWHQWRAGVPLVSVHSAIDPVTQAVVVANQ